MLWGVYFGVILILEKIFILKVLEKLPKVFGHIYTILLVLISWVIFAFEDLREIGIYLGTMFNLNDLYFANPETLYYLKNYIIIIIIGIICSVPFIKFKKLKENRKSIFGIFESIVYILILIICTASLVNNSFNPFLYFRF